MQHLSALQPWISTLTLQQQSVLMLGLRGPDGFIKNSPMKPLHARYRASVLIAAKFGRALEIDEPADTFMSLAAFSDLNDWKTNILAGFFSCADQFSKHYYTHIMHAAEILAYKHPRSIFRVRWHQFYLECCADLHVNAETENQMDERLSDWHQDFWSDEVFACLETQPSPSLEAIARAILPAAFQTLGDRYEHQGNLRAQAFVSAERVMKLFIKAKS